MLRLGFRSLLAAAFFAVAIFSPAFAEEPAKSDVDLKKLSVDELVERLASPEPKPTAPTHDFADPSPTGEAPDPNGRLHPQVKAASEELISRGRSAVPALLKHRRDPRYSWSEVWSRRLDLSVGSRVMRIVEEILEPEVHVEARMGVIKSYPRFTNYLREVGPERYLEWSKNATERERELDLLHWYVCEIESDYRERAPFDLPGPRAWLDEHLVRFRERVAELEAAGVTTKGPRDEAPAMNAEAKPSTGNR